jgi:hypothetical protein
MPSGETESPEVFADRVKRLAAERGLTVNRLALATYDPNVPGLGPDNVKKALCSRPPSRKIIEAVAAVLEVDPFDFPEYSLLLLRHSLDPKTAGLPAAVDAATRLLGAPASLVEAGRQILQVEQAGDEVGAARTAARGREAEALRGRAQQRRERPAVGPEGKPAPRRRRDEQA